MAFGHISYRCLGTQPLPANRSKTSTALLLGHGLLRGLHNIPGFTEDPRGCERLTALG